jgi:DNA-binding transcriptional LysR family regulator
MTTMRVPELGGLNLNLLAALDALLDERNVRRAAERLGVTQSAMSHTLRQLRELFGDPLLVRSGNRMLPTPRAEAVRRPLRQALLQLQAVVGDEAEFVPATAQRRFTLAASDAAAMTVLPVLIARLAAEAPGVDLDVVPVDRAMLPAQLEAGEIDVALAPDGGEAPGVHRQGLYPTEFAVLARADHPGIGPRLTLDAYCRLPHALVVVTGHGPGLVDVALAQQGRQRRVALRIPYFLAAPVVLMGSDLLLTVPRDAAERFAERFALRVDDPPLPLPTGMVSMLWHERFARDPALVWLRALLCQCVPPGRKPRRSR